MCAISFLYIYNKLKLKVKSTFDVKSDRNLTFMLLNIVFFFFRLIFIQHFLSVVGISNVTYYRLCMGKPYQGHRASGFRRIFKERLAPKRLWSVYHYTSGFILQSRQI